MLVDGTTGKTGRLRVFSRHPPLLEGSLSRSSFQKLIEQQTVLKLHGKFCDAVEFGRLLVLHNEAHRQILRRKRQQ